MKQCSNCLDEIPRHKKYCSKSCADQGKTKYMPEIRKCGPCGLHFFYSPKPSSNNSGTYCSTECRNNGYASVPSAHRPRWRSKQQKFLKKNPFCNDCGKSDGRLHVHHIEPYKLSGIDEDWNLVTLCPKCHAKHEKVSTRLMDILDEDIRRTYIAMIQAEFEERWHFIRGSGLYAG